MSILGINTAAIPPRTAAPAGTYPLRIAFMKVRDAEGDPLMSKPKEGSDKPQRRLIQVGFNVVDDTSIDLIMAHLMSNVEGDSEEFIKNNQQTTADFMNCFGLDHELEDLDELASSAPGAEGRVAVGVVAEGAFAGNNEVKRYIVEN